LYNVTFFLGKSSCQDDKLQANGIGPGGLNTSL